MPSFKFSSSPETQNNYGWPVQNAAEKLTDLKTGGTAQVTTLDGKTAALVVMETYQSAAGNQCKRYTIDTSLYLACYNGKWQPVRTFEEK